MAGIPEKKAEALDHQGVAFAKHLGVPLNSERGRAIRYGTKRKGGWHPSTQKRGIRHAYANR